MGDWGCSNMVDQLNSSHPCFEVIAYCVVYFVIIHVQGHLISYLPMIYKIAKVFYAKVYVGADPYSFMWKIKITVNG